jgi:hypothetical protein
MANGTLTLTLNPGMPMKSQLRSIQLELTGRYSAANASRQTLLLTRHHTEYVVASGEPDVLLDTLYRQKLEASGTNLESGPCSFKFDVLVPRKSKVRIYAYQAAGHLLITLSIAPTTAGPSCR